MRLLALLSCLALLGCAPANREGSLTINDPLTVCSKFKYLTGQVPTPDSTGLNGEAYADYVRHVLGCSPAEGTY